jgi:hypothetical protein
VIQNFTESFWFAELSIHVLIPLLISSFKFLQYIAYFNIIPPSVDEIFVIFLH